MEKVTAPFTPDQVQHLNAFQNGPVHSFTCCSPDIPECTRASGLSDGTLIATEEGWTCPCGKYKQDWAHAEMADGSALQQAKLFYENFNIS